MTKSTGVGRGKGAGRPTKYKPEMIRQARALCALGATDHEIARFFKVDDTTLSDWKMRDPRFSRAFKAGKGPADERVKKRFYDRAIGYTHDSEEIHLVDRVEIIKGEISTDPVTGKQVKEKDRIIRTKEVLRVPVRKHYPPEPKAAAMWLINRKHEEFANRKAIEHTTPPGKPLELTHHVVPTEPELIGAYHERLRRAAAVSSGTDTRSAQDMGRDRQPGNPKATSGSDKDPMQE